jgi:arsenite methyltransferase
VGRRKLVGEDLKEKVRERYAGAVRAVRDAGGDGSASCCEPSCCGSDVVAREVEDRRSASPRGSSCCGSGSRAFEVDMTGGSYSAEELDELPETVTTASLGCGNPTALATLSPGGGSVGPRQRWRDRRAASARRVAPGGKAYGLDMIDQMLALARENREKAGVESVEFLKGVIVAVPLPDDHADVVISNCVINLSSEEEGCDRSSRL